MEPQEGQNADQIFVSTESIKETDLNLFKIPQPTAPYLSSEKNIIQLPDALTTHSPPAGKYFIECVKNGIVVERKDFNSSRKTFGRSRDCDFSMNHPSISRLHAVILWSDSHPSGQDKFYLVDLNSTHGTFLNKEKIKQGEEKVEISPGNNVIQFGGSSRYFMLESTSNQTEEDFSTFQDTCQSEDVGIYKASSMEKEDDGCDWGFKDDFNYESIHEQGEEVSLIGNILALISSGISGPTKNDNVYNTNSQKCIQQWFDREGYDFEYNVNYQNGQFKCSIELPIDGQYLPIEGCFCAKVVAFFFKNLSYV